MTIALLIAGYEQSFHPDLSHFIEILTFFR